MVRKRGKERGSVLSPSLVFSRGEKNLQKGGTQKD